MKSMNAKKIDNDLKTALNLIVENKEQYVKCPTINFTRNRKLSMKNTMIEILSMGGESLPKEILKFSDIHNVELTSSAFIQQRSKILPSAFKDLFYNFNKLSDDKKTYHGYKVLAVDGSEIDCFRNPNSKNHMITQQSPKGFNKVHLNALYDVLNKTYVDVCLQPRPASDEQGALVKMVTKSKFIGKNLIIADRGYESYNTLMHLCRTENIDFMCRARHGHSVLRGVSKLPMMELDTDIYGEITIRQTNEDKAKGRIFLQTGSKKGKINSPKTTTTRWDFESPCAFSFRVVRFLLETGEYETIITSLNREEFPAPEIKKLYHMRWGIETSFRGLKYNVGLINLHSKKDELIDQEIYAALTMYNYCSRIAAAVSVNKTKETKYAYIINYSVTVTICKQFLRKQKSDFEELLQVLIKHTVPIRPGRKDIRNIRLKGFVGFTYRVAA